MDIDVNIGRIDIKIDEIRCLHTFRHQPLIGTYYCPMEIGVFHKPSIHEEIIVNALLSRSFRLTHEPGNLTQGSIHIYGQQLLAEFLSEHVNDTLTQCASPQIEQLLLIAIDRKMNIRINQYYPLESRENIIHLSGIRLKELSTCRNVKKQIINTKITTHRAGYRFLRDDP